MQRVTCGTLSTNWQHFTARPSSIRLAEPHPSCAGFQLLNNLNSLNLLLSNFLETILYYPFPPSIVHCQRGTRFPGVLFFVFCFLKYEFLVWCASSFRAQGLPRARTCGQTLSSHPAILMTTQMPSFARRHSRRDKVQYCKATSC